MKLRFIFLGAMIILINILTKAQTLTLYQVDSLEHYNSFETASNFSNEQELAKEIRKIIPSLYQQGYLSASIDSIAINKNQYLVYYFSGPKYQWVNLGTDSIPKGIFVSANIDAQQYTNKAISPKSIAQLSEKILNYCEENGYPFAQIWLQNVQEKSNGKISAQLRLDRKEHRTIDSIIIEGDIRISNIFLHRYLDILKGSEYNEKKLRALNQRFAELPFLQLAAPWNITFRPGDTRLNLVLREKKSNQLNAIMGLMPNNLQANKLLLTADVQFALQNLLGKGESISASFQNLQVKSPRIKADVILPYIAQTPIGAEVHFDFFTSNLQFRKIILQTGLRFNLSSTDLIKLYYQTIENRIIEIDTQTIFATKQLPANIDSKANGIGVEIQSNHTDNKLNPKRGLFTRINAVGLQRKIIKNNTILGLNDGSSFNFSTLYDSIKKSSFQYQLSAEITGFIPLGRNFTLKLGYNGGIIAAPQIFQNELFLIGGFKLLRGFDEQSIFANQYHISITELRLRFNQNSFFYLFSDNGWVQTRFNNYNRSGLHNGFGIGTSLQTKTGQFAIALAFGRNDQIPLRFRESKISFGYIALF
jgi:outer membrane protein assembly factor BamA